MIMIRLKIYFIIFGILLLVSCQNPQETVDESRADKTNTPRVELKENDKGYQRLFVDGEEFYVMGAGLEHGNIDALAQHGANSFRTWRTDNGKQSGQEVLDAAHEKGLMVLMGLDFARERHGFDYSDAAKVAAQKEEFRQKVLIYKDHPALLGWGLGNELNLRYTNKQVWDAVNDIAKMIHKIDGNHPTTTMLAGIGKEEVDYISTNCPDLDFISIQLYGEIINLQQRLDKVGYDGPYMVTEWGATGHWEAGKTNWGAPIEENSTEKALAIQKRFEKAILIDSSRCLGSYVFLWGQKQERTPTWYGLFTENGEESPAIDVMHYFWNDNQWPANRAPEIKSATLNGKFASQSVHLTAGDEVEFAFDAVDPDEDEMSWRFEVLPEATDLHDGGDAEKRPIAIEDLLVSEAVGKITFKVPDQSGAYRAFIYILDGQNNAATVNIPFHVD